jgi:hypothetical protein
MTGYQYRPYTKIDLSVAMEAGVAEALERHFAQHFGGQEDLSFAYWQPSRGMSRYSAILQSVNLPKEDERVLQGNVAFTVEYLSRTLRERPKDCGVALIHSHLGPGWQGMSHDDVVAERDRLAGVVCSQTGLPLVGLTWGTDGSWSGRFWLRTGRHRYAIRQAISVRSVGRRLGLSFHPILRGEQKANPAQAATVSVWGEKAQSQLRRAHIGIVGVGSVGSIVAEALARIGVERITLIDYDRIETRNLDRTLGTVRLDAVLHRRKVAIGRRQVGRSHTSRCSWVRSVPRSLLTEKGLAVALDCDVLISCVDRPLPRSILNAVAYAHLIPVIDGGIIARVDDAGKLMHVDWRIHTVGPGYGCLYCIDALRRSDVALDRDGLLEDPDYVRGLSPADRERYGRRNVFAFSLSVAAHEVLQLVTLISGNQRVGGIGGQVYHGYPGAMEVRESMCCSPECEVGRL